MRVMQRTAYVQATHFVSSNGTNPQSMFNNTISEKTTRAGDLTVVVTPGLIGAVGFAGLEGNDLTVVGTSDSVEVFRHEQSLTDELVSDWFEYFFEPFDFVEFAYIDGIPPYSDIQLTVTVSGSNTACGVFAFGQSYTFGDTLIGVQVGIQDYSTKETDPVTGVTTFSPGPFSRQINATAMIPIGLLNRFQRVLTSQIATPTFYAFGNGTTFDDAVTVFGFYRDLTPAVQYPQHFLCSFEIEGLT